MNNDSPPSSDLPTAASTSQEASASQPSEITAASREQQQTPNLTPAQKRVQAQTKKKYEFVNSLMANLDTLIYAELCILYYME
jgi:hypothetical protein